MEFVLMLVPVVFLAVSVTLAIRAVKRGKKTRNAVMAQLLSFVAVCVVTFAIPMIASAASTDGAATATQTQTTATDNSKSMGLLAAAIVTSISGIGGGIAVAASAPAAIGATSEDPKSFGKALIFVALGEGIALYGVLISILILGKV
jgi:ATP synthase subunit C.